MKSWNPDSLHRLAKTLADSGEAQTLEEAHATFSRYGIHFVIHDNAMAGEALQTIALTAINAAARSFTGNVSISGNVDHELSVRGFKGTTIRQFANWLGVDIGTRSSDYWPVIFVGAGAVDAPAGSILPWAEGWQFGLGRRNFPAARTSFAPACVAAAGLAVSEAFSVLRGDNPYAGRRRVDLSLWSPFGPTLAGRVDPVIVPRTWLVGLGHLGQASAWTMGFMQAPEQALYLQDFDLTTKSSLSTSMLCAASDVGRPKVDVVGDWLRARGYNCVPVERRFDSTQRVSAGDPRVALFGVDNAAARRVSEGAGFEFIVDAGLGAGFKDFRTLRVRTFPGPSTAANLWARDSDVEDLRKMPAYQRLLADGAEPCGVTTLASRSVGAPFVGCVAAAYALAELVRHEIGADNHAVVDTNLRDPGAVQAVVSVARPATV